MKPPRLAAKIGMVMTVRGKQVYDANIVATMLVYSIDTLLTLNVDDFKRYADIITVVSPAS